VLFYSNSYNSYVISQIAKPAETDFEQSILSIFDDRKATNFTQSIISDNIDKLSLEI